MPKGKGWIKILLMIRLFTVPVSNAKLKRMFSKLNYVKTSFGCSLDVKYLEIILKIMIEPGSRKTFDPIQAIKKWSIDKFRHTTEDKGSKSYESHYSAEANVKSLDDDCCNEEEKYF